MPINLKTQASWYNTAYRAVLLVLLVVTALIVVAIAVKVFVVANTVNRLVEDSNHRSQATAKYLQCTSKVPPQQRSLDYLNKCADEAFQ